MVRVVRPVKVTSERMDVRTRSALLAQQIVSAARQQCENLFEIHRCATRSATPIRTRARIATSARNRIAHGIDTASVRREVRFVLAVVLFPT